MSSAIQEQRSSQGLASRPSFFGGFVSTRKASALPTWKPAPALESQSGQNSQLTVNPGTKGKPVSQVKAAPAPPPDPLLLRKQQLKTNRNFDSDSDTEAEKSKPRAYNIQQLTQLEQKLNAAEKAATAKHPALKPQQHLQQQQQQSTYKSPYANVTSRGATHVRTVAPKGKAGAGSRSMALAPQAIALSRKQMADRGIRQAVDSVRSHAPSPPPHRLASQANPSSSSQPSGSSHQLPSSSNRGPSTMPSTFGRPVQAFAAPSSRPLPPSNPRQGTLGHAAQRPAADAQRYPAQAMPAWMQKAKQAVLAGRGAKRMRPEEDEYDNAAFVVDDEEEPDWRQALKSVTGYDPSKFDDQGFDDRSMEASYKQIQAEERRSARMGRDDDRRAEEEELRQQEEKRKKKKRAKASSGLVM